MYDRMGSLSGHTTVTGNVLRISTTPIGAGVSVKTQWGASQWICVSCSAHRACSVFTLQSRALLPSIYTKQSEAVKHACTNTHLPRFGGQSLRKASISYMSSSLISLQVTLSLPPTKQTWPAEVTAVCPPQNVSVTRDGVVYRRCEMVATVGLASIRLLCSQNIAIKRTYRQKECSPCGEHP